MHYNPPPETEPECEAGDMRRAAHEDPFRQLSANTQCLTQPTSKAQENTFPLILLSRRKIEEESSSVWYVITFGVKKNTILLKKKNPTYI